LNLKNLPNVAVHDIVIHPRENDLILATHGRSLWIFDDATVIQQMTPQILDTSAHLFTVRPGLRFTSRFTRYGIGDKVFTGPNPAAGALITYYLKEKIDDKADFKIQVFDRDGKLVQDLERPSREKGLNRTAWNLRLGGPEVRRPPTPEQIAFGGGSRGAQVMPGTYTVKMTAGGKVYEEPVEVKLYPGINAPVAELKPAFARLTADSEGALWVEAPPALESDPGQADVFDVDGRLLGRVPLPGSFRIKEIGTDYVLGVARDEDTGLEQVRLYRLDRGAAKTR
jgi:hypothetical protein